MAKTENHNGGYIKESTVTQWLMVMVISTIGCLWYSLSDQLTDIEKRLHKVELNQTKILTTMGIDPVVSKKSTGLSQGLDQTVIGCLYQRNITIAHTASEIR